MLLRDARLDGRIPNLTMAKKVGALCLGIFVQNCLESLPKMSLINSERYHSSVVMVMGAFSCLCWSPDGPVCLAGPIAAQGAL